ncbi:MAG: DUF6273 domain-containing protein [Synergistaceae bacterium]|nr:DUF6273 domain-containing protein [Synergistaceae bacterium]
MMHYVFLTMEPRLCKTNFAHRFAKYGLPLLMAILLIASSFADASRAAEDGKIRAYPVGTPCDGIDFSELAARGSGFYYGAYRHAAAIDYADFPEHGVTYDDERAPVLWRVMGEESGDGLVTLMSKYALDGYFFYRDWRNPVNIWRDSDLRAWLNDPGYDGAAQGESEDEGRYGFLHPNKNPFTVAEFGDGRTGPIVTSTVKTNVFRLEDATLVPGGTKTTTDLFYLPWGTFFWDSSMPQNQIGWGADDGGGPISGDSRLIAEGDEERIPVLRGGDPDDKGCRYWLRSPHSKADSHLYIVDRFGLVYEGSVDTSIGVRPIFKLNPSSVLFISEVSDGFVGDYSDDPASVNYKLTIVNPSLSLADLRLDGKPLASGQTLFVPSGGSVTLAGNVGRAQKMAYKIVENAGEGVSSITGHGVSRAAPVSGDVSLIVRGKRADGENLPPGRNYTLYVWAQNDNPINSDEGSPPMYLRLDVEPDGEGRDE